jgi:threonine aldolase
MDKIDFRSDTVTWPTETMRRAMAGARVGDDVHGEDPTVNELETRAASLAGKEAGLLVASGTMGNLVAILTHANRGDEALVGRDAHTISWEAGGMAVLGGIVPQTLPTDEMGRMDLAELEAAIRPDDPHLPRTRLILLENSYGARAGAAIPPDYFAAVAELARRHGLKVHLDGARLFNAAIALGVPAEDLTRHVDSVTFCLSKGLCAPVGSVLCGSAAFIAQARRTRKLLGGGMRQAGVLAAAGLVALDEMIDRLADDHVHARCLAEELATIPGIVVAPDKVQTNMVFFGLGDEIRLSREEVIARLQQDNVLLDTHGPREFRAVTHYWIGMDEVAFFVDRLRAALHG